MKQKQNKLKLTIILILLTACIGTTYAQVTIGSGLEPVQGALLDLKEKDDPSGGVTSEKGLNLSRVRLTDRNNLYPMFETAPGSGIANSDYNASDKKAAQDAIHTGLTVYNVNEANGFVKCVYVWVGNKWISLCDGNTSAVCPLELKNAASGGQDKYTETVEATTNQSTTATYAIKGQCCTTSGNYTYTILSGTGLTSSGTDVEVSPQNTSGVFSVTFRTANPGAAPRVTLVKVADPCGNTAYFTAVQKGTSTSANCPLTLNNYTETVASTTLTHGTITATKGSCCSGANYTYTKISGDGTLSVTTNTSGEFTVTYNAANTSAAPRVTVVKVTDDCGNAAYFAAVQQGPVTATASTACSMTFNGTSPANDSYADKPYIIFDPEAYVPLNNANIVTAVSSCCSADPATPFSMSITGGNFDNSGNVHLDFMTTPNENTRKNTGTFRLQWKTPNPNIDPRVAVVKVTDDCGNSGYFTVIQRGKDSTGALTFKGTAPSPEGNNYADKPYWISDAGGATLANANIVTAISEKCPSDENPFKSISIIGGNFDNSGNAFLDFTTTPNENARNNTGTFRLQWKTSNPNTDPRVAVVKIVDDCDNIGYFTAVQKGQASSGSTDKCHMTFSGGNAYREVAAAGENNIEITASSTCCTISGNWSFTSGNTGVINSGTVSGNGAATYRVNVPANTSAEPRTILLTIKDPCDNYGYYVIIQKGAVCPVTFSNNRPYAIIASTATSATTGVSSSCCTIANNTNLPVSLLPAGNYASASVSNGTLTVTFTGANTSETDDRTAVVTVTDACGNTGYFTVVQKVKAASSAASACNITVTGTAGLPYVILNPAETAITGNITAAYSPVNCCTQSGSWTFSSTSGILTGLPQYPSAGSITGVAFNGSNTGQNDRVAVIKITDPCGNEGYFVAIQKGTPPLCEITATERVKVVASSATSASFTNLSSSSCCTNQTFSIDGTVTGGSATISGTTLNVTFAANTSETDDRIVVVRVKDGCGNAGTFTVVKKAKAAVNGMDSVGQFIPGRAVRGIDGWAAVLNQSFPAGKYRVYGWLSKESTWPARVWYSVNGRANNSVSRTLVDYGSLNDGSISASNLTTDGERVAMMALMSPAFAKRQSQVWYNWCVFEIVIPEAWTPIGSDPYGDQGDTGIPSVAFDGLAYILGYVRMQ